MTSHFDWPRRPFSPSGRPRATRAWRIVIPLLCLWALSGCGNDEAPAPTEESHPSVVLITGSTDGLGRELALRAAATGAHVIIHGRNEARANEVAEAIRSEGAGSASIHLADFASLDAVREMATAIRADYERLDLLVNNAGVGPGEPGHERVVTGDGHELRMQVNYLAGYLLTRELLPLLEAGAPSRIVSVASRNQQPLDFDDLSMSAGYTGGQAYGRSKLAQILMTLDLVDELAPRGIELVAVHPAPAMETALVLETGATPQSTVEAGADAVWQAMYGSDFPSGTYFHELQPSEPHAQALDPEVRARLRAWSDSVTREP